MNTMEKYLDNTTDQVCENISRMLSNQWLDSCWLFGVADRGINRAGGSTQLFMALQNITNKASNGELKLSTDFTDRVQVLFYNAGQGSFYESLNELNNIAEGMVTA